jgi:hypothetical protein
MLSADPSRQGPSIYWRFGLASWFTLSAWPERKGYGIRTVALNELPPTTWCMCDDGTMPGLKRGSDRSTSWEHPNRRKSGPLADPVCATTFCERSGMSAGASQTMVCTDWNLVLSKMEMTTMFHVFGSVTNSQQMRVIYAEKNPLFDCVPYPSIWILRLTFNLIA